MPKCVIDSSVERVRRGDMEFPLGVYPVEEIDPAQGYAVEYEPADAGEGEEQWEEWPDRYAYEIVITAARLESLTRAVLGLLPGRVYPILDYLGHDAYREIDPYIAYEPVGLDRFLDGMRIASPFLYEDGLCGFGAMCDDPFVYFFIDEHKIMTLRLEPEARERADRILAAFDLSEIEEPRGADAAAHEHRSVLLAPDDRPDLLAPDEIVEFLRGRWALTLNIDPEENVDDHGSPIGCCAWRCLVRFLIEDRPTPVYIEVKLLATCYRVAEQAALDAAMKELGVPEETLLDVMLVAADRLSPDAMERVPTENPPTAPGDGTVLHVRTLG